MDLQDFDAHFRFAQRETRWWKQLVALREAYEQNRLEGFTPDTIPNLIGEGEDLLASMAVLGISGQRRDGALEALRQLRGGQAQGERVLADARKGTVH